MLEGKGREYPIITSQTRLVGCLLGKMILIRARVWRSIQTFNFLMLISTPFGMPVYQASDQITGSSCQSVNRGHRSIQGKREARKESDARLEDKRGFLLFLLFILIIYFSCSSYPLLIHRQKRSITLGFFSIGLVSRPPLCSMSKGKRWW